MSVFSARGAATGERAPARLPVLARAAMRRTVRSFGLAVAGLAFAAGAQATMVVSQSVSASSIVVGDRTRLTITVSNDSVQEDGVQLVNNLPAQLRLYPAGHPGYVAPSSTCANLVFNPAPGAGPGGVDVMTATGFSVPAHVGGLDGSCTISFDLTSYQGGGTWNNVIQATDLTPAAASTAQQSVLVNNILLPAVSKNLGTTALVQGATRIAVITFTNPNQSVNIPFTSFTDTLPSNLEVVDIQSNSCGSTITHNSNSVTLTGGAIPAGSAGASGSCTLRFTVRGVLAPGQASAPGTNTIAPGDIGNTRGLTYPGASTNITVNSPIALSKGFSVTPLTAGADSLLTVRIGNQSSAPLTGVSLSDVVGSAWPAALRNSGPIGTANLSNCGAGATLTAGSDGGVDKGFVLGNATVAVNQECVISFNVTSTTVGTHANSFIAGAVGNNEGFTSPARGASIEVRDNALTVSKAITPTTVAPGDVATFAVSVTSYSLAPQTNVSFTDTLPAGMVYVDASTGGMQPAISSTGAACSFVGAMPTPLVTAPAFSFNFPGAAPGGTTCTVTFTARVPANAAPNTLLTNASFNAGNGTVTGSSGAVSLRAVNPLVVTKTFDGVVARQRFQGTPSVVQIELTNNNFSVLSNLSFTDSLPAALRVADPANATTTCGGTITATPGDTNFTLNGGSLPARAGAPSFAPGQCSVRVNVVGGTIGVHTNDIPAFNGSNAAATVSATGTVANVPGSTVRNLNATSATLEYLPALTVAKTFLTNPVQVGGTSRVRITLGNTGNGQLTGVRATDPLAGTGLLVATPANASTTCAGPVVLNVPDGGSSAAISGATIAGSTSCDFLFDVVTSTSTPSVNTLAPGAVTADGGVATTQPTTATLNKVTSSINLTKAFSPTTISGPGSVSRLTINIDNTSATALTNLAVADQMPVGMLVGVVPNASTTCAGGLVDAVTGASTVRLTGGSLPGNSACTVSVDITSSAVGTLNNTLAAGAVTNTQGVTNADPFTANLAALAGLGVEKHFEPTAVAAGQPALLVIRVRNSLPQPLTNISTTDNLPAGMVVATPANASSTCSGAVITAVGDKVSFRGAQLPVGPSECVVRVNVVVPTAGAYVNTIPGGTVIANEGAVTNPQPGPSATLHVLQPPTVAKAFSVSPVAPGTPSRLTVTIGNPNATQALTGVALRDNLPTGLFVAQVPNPSTTCVGGTVSAIASATGAQIAGATVPAGGSCTFSFDTVSNVPGLYTNTIPAGAITSTEGVSNPDPATAPLRVLEPPTVLKTFVPPTISPNGISRLTITLGNANTGAQTLLQALDDPLPAGVLVASPPNIGGTCATGSVTATAGSALVRYASGASIPPGGCTISVNVTAATAGTYPNVILAGALRTDAGINPTPAEAELVVSPLGSISGRIYFDANNNGMYDIGEAPLAGQSVSLIRALTSEVLQKTTTDASGFYVFRDLQDSTALGSDYTVRYLRGGADTLGSSTSPTASLPLNPGSGSFQARLTPASTSEASIVSGTGIAGTPNNSNVDNISRRSNIRLNLAGGTVASAVNQNFGELRPSEIAGKVYRDDNHNGVANGTEPGIAGAEITLSGVDDLGQPVLRTTTTDANGNYRFADLRPSCAPLAAPSCPGYVVTQGAQPANTVNGTPSAGTVVNIGSGSAVGTAGTASNNAPALSHGAPAGTSRVAGIVLPPYARSADNNFGEIGNDRSVAGRVFIDRNGDGSFNGSDSGVGTGAPGANNVPQTLTLTGNDLSGNPVTLTTTTDANGEYRFDGVPPGSNYTVTCTTCAPPAGHINSSTPLAWPGSTGGTAGGTQTVPTLTGIDLSGPQTESVNNHFTKSLPGSQISGVVYFDPDNSGGLFTTDDLPAPNQTVELRDQGTNNLIATTTTDANGAYSFPGLPAGTYRVVMPTLPGGTTHGNTSAGTLGGAPNGTASAPGAAPASIANITVAADQSTANHNFPLVSDIRIGGRVYEDRDFDGQFGGPDVGLPGSTLGLVGTDAFGNAITRYTTTDGSGQYSFTGLPPGSYTVRQTQPLGYTSVANTPGPVTGGSAGAVGPLGGAVETMAFSFNATPGAALQVNFGEALGDGAGVRGYKSARIVTPAAAVGVSPGAEVVWQVIYQNNTAYPVTMDVRDTLPDYMTRSGAPAITHSGGNGGVFTPNAGFTGTAGGNLLGSAFLPAGAWVAVDVPVLVTAGATTTRFNQATAGALDIRTDAVDDTTPTGGPGQPPSGVIPPGSVPQTPYQTPGLDPTGVPLSALPASLSGYVWRDNNGDRQRDGGDTPIPDWAVEVVDSSGNAVACRTVPTNSANGCVAMPDGRSLFRTGADGAYGVIGLVPGDYKVFFRDPANNVVYGTPQNTGGDTSSKLSSGRDHLAVTLLPGADLRQQDLPLDPSGVIYDANTRAPIDGASVRFCGPAGFNPATMLVGGASYTVVGGCAQMVTGPNGFYQFLLAPGAPSGEYGLEASAPSYAPTPIASIPPAPGVLTPSGATPYLVQAQAGPPSGGQPTTYHLRMNLAPGMPDVVHNHIPLEPFAGGGLFLQKQANRDVVEIGDSVQYTLRVMSPNGAASNVVITDSLPAGLRLIPGTVAQDGVAVADPAGSPGPVLNFALGGFAANTPVTVTYRVRVGVGAQQGDGINRAQAQGTVGGLTVLSNRAQARIRITGGVFFQEACVMGKVFVDCNRNRIQDGEEVGIPGVRLYLQDGTHLISDSEGKYSICGLPARTSVLRVDPTTLPAGSQLVTSSNRNALDAGSLFLDLKFGELHRADFIEGSCAPEVMEQVEQRRRLGQIVAPLVDPPSPPKPRVFRSGKGGQP